MKPGIRDINLTKNNKYQHTIRLVHKDTDGSLVSDPAGTGWRMGFYSQFGAGGRHLADASVDETQVADGIVTFTVTGDQTATFPTMGVYVVENDTTDLQYLRGNFNALEGPVE